MKRREFIGLLGGAAHHGGKRVAGAGAGARKNSAHRLFLAQSTEPNVSGAGLRRGCGPRIRPRQQASAGRALCGGRSLANARAYRGASGARGRRAGDGDFALIQANALTTTVPIVGVARDFVGVGLAATFPGRAATSRGCPAVGRIQPEMARVPEGGSPEARARRFPRGVLRAHRGGKASDWSRLHRVSTSR